MSMAFKVYIWKKTMKIKVPDLGIIIKIHTLGNLSL